MIDAEVYARLHSLAGKLRNSHGRALHTLPTTAILHEAWVKLERSEARFESRTHFMAVAAKAMRQVMVDWARAKAASKRGGDLRRTSLPDFATTAMSAAEILELDQAMQHLAEVDLQSASLVELRVFCGMTMAEAAAQLGSSERSLARKWRFAQAYLVDALA